jgi:AcrR family transcriptional regulator
MVEIKKPEKAVRKPTQERAKETVNVILSAAAQILGSVGFDSSTTNRIAEKAGVSIGSLYQYFPNKEKLAIALIERYLNLHAEKFRARLQEDAGRPFEEVVQRLSEEVVTMYLENRKLLKVIGGLIPRFQQIPVVLEVRREVVLVLAQEIERRRLEYPIQDTELAAFIIVNAGMGIIQTMVFDESLTYDAAIVGRGLAQMALGYLRQEIN